MKKQNGQVNKMSGAMGVAGRYRFTTYKAGTKEVIRQTPWIKNKIVSSSGYGLNIIARILSGDTTYGLTITQAKIGDDNTPPTLADTGLGNAVLSNIPVANQSVSNSVVTLLFFMADIDLPNGTYEEFGIFCTNQLFARSIISPAYTKASNEDTQAEYELTFTSL